MPVAPVHLPGIFQSMAPLLDHYGYLAVAGFIFLEDFGTPFVPGETVLIAAALYAGAGRLNVVAVGVLALVAAVLGDNVGFAIGHFAGREVVVRWGRYLLLTEERLAKAEKFFAHHGGKVVTVARFIDGLRQANGIVAGLTEMPWRRFIIFNTVGAVAWVGCWLTVGYTAGGHITSIYHWFSRFAVYALVLLIVAVVALLARWFVRRRKSMSVTTDGLAQEDVRDGADGKRHGRRDAVAVVRTGTPEAEPSGATD